MPVAPQTAENEGERAGPSAVRALLDALAEPALVVRERRVALANAAARQVLGEAIEGEDVRLAIRHPAATERLLDRQGGDGDAVELVGLGEAQRRWTMTVAALPDGAQLVRLEDRSSAHAAEKMRTDFVANASHELRTPLATLLGFIETLEDLNESPDPERERDTRRRFLRIMDGEARRMHRLVDDLMSLSRVEADRYSPARDAHDMLALVEQARGEQLRLSEERASPMLIDAPQGLPPVAGDRPQLLQMTDNLIANALKYGRPGTPVLIKLGLDGQGMIELSITDQSEGIAREHLPRITERFYRVDAGRSRAGGGTGLGLSIVKHVVERHRGRLSFDSVVGRGTTVTVALPAAGAGRLS